MAEDILLSNNRLLDDYEKLAADPVPNIYLLPPISRTNTGSYTANSLLGLHFVSQGPYKGAIIKFSIVVSSAYPLLAKPVINILAPHTIFHPQVKTENHRTFVMLDSWDAEKHDLTSLVKHMRDVFETPIGLAITKDQIEFCVNKSIEEACVVNQKDIFSYTNWSPQVASSVRAWTGAL